MSRRVDLNRHWPAKLLAGLVAGLALALALSGWLTWFGPGGSDALNKYQVSMWLVPPLWLAALGACWAFRSGWHAWGWLGGLAALAWAVLALARQVGG